MKRNRGILLIGLLACLACHPVWAESYAALETDDGKVDVVGCETYSYEGKNYVYILLNYENRKQESAAPWLEYSVYTYQDGIQLESAYFSRYAPEGYYDNDTNARPGSILPFYMIYQLRNTTSPVEVEVKESLSWNDETAECILELPAAGQNTQTNPENGNAGSAESTGEASGNTKEGPEESELSRRLTELEERVRQLEETVEDLQKTGNQEDVVIVG